MNNLKRVLSLGLVGTMLTGMMVMGASAADFTDAEKIEHSEAVNVLVALKVINGKDDGSFDPQGNVTRAEMAKMIAVAMNGGSEATTGTKTTPTFTDIGGHWAESYIEYCADLGIISGRGDGTFDPGANVTGLEATKMVLSALGFDSNAYKLTGATWAVRTDEVARTQTGLDGDPSLYEDLTSTVLATAASRDTAAQLIWNGLQNHTRVVTPDKNTNSGEVTWQYSEGKNTLLKERYDGEVVTGTFVGNYDTGTAQNEGEISVDSYSFPSDLDISYIGEEVKVVYKNGSRSTSKGPDKNDIIYGAFVTGDTEVIWTTMNDIKNQKSKDAKVNVGGTNYTTEDSVLIYKNYITNEAERKSAIDGDSDNNSALTKALKEQCANKIKLVSNPTSGKIDRVYIVEYFVGEVTGLSSSKVTISGVGAIDIADNDIYDGIAKDDVVVYTKFYDEKKDDAFFTVTKAESVEGELTGYKLNKDDVYDNVVVDGTTYNTNKTLGVDLKELANVTEDVILKPASKNIGDTVRLYLIDGLAVALESLESSGGNYALITDTNNVAAGTAGNTLNGWTIEILKGDGEKAIYAVHKDSVYDKNGTETKLNEEAKPDDIVKEGALIDYSINNGKVKIKDIKAEPTEISSGDKVWDKTAKQLVFGNGAGDKAVADPDAIAFVYSATNDDYYVYNLRGLGNISREYTYKDGGVQKSGVAAVSHFMNDDNQIDVAFLKLGSKPGSASADTLYGIVTGYIGTRKNGDDTYYGYKVAVSEERTVEVYVDDETAGKLNRNNTDGELVEFDETADGYYDADEITILTGGKTIANKAWVVAAVNNYKSNTLSYYLGTERVDAKSVFTGVDGGSITVDKDATIVYVDKDGKKAGADTGISSFDTATGYANILFHIDDDGVVDVIFVETSGEKSIVTSADFGKKTGALNVSGSVTGGSSTYTVTVGDAEVGADFTVTVKCTALDAASTKGETVTLTYDDQTVTLTFTKTGEQTATFTGVKDVETVSGTAAVVE